MASLVQGHAERVSPEKQIPEGFSLAVPNNWLFLYILLLPSLILFHSKSATGARENTHGLHLVYTESHGGFARNENFGLMKNTQFTLKMEINEIIKITFFSGVNRQLEGLTRGSFINRLVVLLTYSPTESSLWHCGYQHPSLGTINCQKTATFYTQPLGLFS